MSLPDWWPDWNGETCIIVASGPSAKDAPLIEAKEKARFIAINESWRLAPWTDILFGCDFAWWKHRQGCPEFQGLKLSTDIKVFGQPKWNVQRVGLNKGSDHLELEKIGTVGWGGNSGFHCLNLAVQFGCTKVILVGYDMTVRGGVHWHGSHPKGLNNPTSGNVERWRKAVDGAAKLIEERGIKVINCSPESALRNYPKMTLPEAMEC